MTDHQCESAEIDWADCGVPVSRRFGDPYFFVSYGLAETRHVFLAGNRLPARFAQGFQIAELGFGTGLNLLAAWDCWRQSGQRGDLHFTSFEAFPMSGDDMARALSPFLELSSLIELFLSRWRSGQTCFRLDGLSVEIVLGDARHTLAEWPGKADAWFLDGFAPARNPELWSPELLATLASKTRPAGTLATYSAAGHVRRTLASVGFQVERTEGFGQKRHMTIGSLRDQA